MPEKILTPIKAIRAYCIECSGGAKAEVKFCTTEKCSLYPYRMGKRPKVDNSIEKNKIDEKSGS